MWTLRVYIRTVRGESSSQKMTNQRVAIFVSATGHPSLCCFTKMTRQPLLSGTPCFHLRSTLRYTQVSPLTLRHDASPASPVDACLPSVRHLAASQLP